MGVDDMIRGLEPFIGHDIPKRRARPFQRRYDLFPAPGGDAAKDVPRSAVAQNLVAKGGVAVDIAAGVALDRGKADIHRRIAVHLGHGGQHAGPARFGDQRVTAKARIEKPKVNAPFHATPKARKPRIPVATPLRASGIGA